MKKITKFFMGTMFLISVHYASAQCYTSLYPSATNLCPDPEITNLSLWNGWGGQREVVTGDGGAFCGDSYMKLVSDGNGAFCGWPGNNGEDSALDINLTWESNATYRVHAMVKTIGGTIGFLANGTDPNFGTYYDTGGEWQLVDETFSTGVTAGSGFISFNTCDSDGTATEIHIDNYELYRVDTLGLDDVISVVSSNVSAVGNRIFVSKVKASTDIQIYSITGALIKSFKTNNDINFNFKSGLWIVTIKTFEGQKSVKLVVK